jgi:hypothetical protein
MEWRLMVLPNYTSRKLTVHGDKLPAISTRGRILLPS